MHAFLIWLAAGLVICGLEILISGLIVFWFGVGGLLTAVLCLAGVLPGFGIQILFFFASSLVFLFCWFFFFKRLFQKNRQGDSRDPTLDGLRGKVTEAIRPGNPGRVVLHKAFHGIQSWKAESEEIIEEGKEVSVREASGIALKVKEMK